MLWVLIWIASTSRCNSNEYPRLYKEVKKKYTGCNLKTMEFLDCALIGVCVVIRSNTVGLAYAWSSENWSNYYYMNYMPLIYLIVLLYNHIAIADFMCLQLLVQILRSC